MDELINKMEDMDMDKDEKVIDNTEAVDLEEMLRNIHCYPEIDQLEMLIQEIRYIRFHEMNPPDDWFETRIKKIEEYYALEWKAMAERYYFNDTYLHSHCVEIIQGLTSLLSTYEMVHTFHLNEYQRTLEVIQKTWKFYDKKYVGGEVDDDIVDITSSMMYL
jgi:hypothetical protein